MLATFGALLAQENVTVVTVLPFESCAVAENPSCWLGEMDAFRGRMLMVAGGPIVVDEELPPQFVRETPRPASTSGQPRIEQYYRQG